MTPSPSAPDPLAPVRSQLARGALAEAEATCRAVLARGPDARAFGLLAHVLHRQQRLEEAFAATGEALARDPALVPARLERAALARRLHRWEAAREALDWLLARDPGRAALHHDLGVALAALGERDGARASFAAALRRDPRLAETHYALGALELAAERGAAALDAFAQACALRPTWADAWIARTEALLLLGRAEDAVRCGREALRLAPDAVPALRAAGRALRLAKTDLEAWVAIRERLADRDPGPASALELAAAYWEAFRFEDAARALDAALARDPDYWPARWARFQYPESPFVRDDDAAAAYRARWRAGVADLAQRLAENPGRVEEARDCVRLCTNFYLHYLGEPLREDQAAYGRLLEMLMARAAPVPRVAPGPRAGRRVRVGFASAHLRNHTIAKLFAPLITGLDRDRFEVQVFKLEAGEDATSARIAAGVDRFVVDQADVGRWITHLEAARLDVLVHLDVGMHPIAQALAALRFAPHQAALWGHPVTTGLASIDTFLSSAAMEPPDGQRHYTERLHPLPRLGIVYEPPTAVPRRPASFSPNPHPGGVDFFVAQTVYKLGPAHDAVFARIAQALPGVRFHLLPHPLAHVREALRARMRPAFAARGLDLDRHLVLHPALPLEEFLGLALACDLNLDSLGWSGGNTTLEILWHGVPTLTLEGEVMRARHTGAMLRLLDLPELVTRDVDAYVAAAVALGGDPDRRRALAACIAERKATLYRDPTPLRALAAFLTSVA